MLRSVVSLVFVWIAPPLLSIWCASPSQQRSNHSNSPSCCSYNWKVHNLHGKGGKVGLSSIYYFFAKKNNFVSLTFTGLTFDLILYSEKFSLPKTRKVSSVELASRTLCGHWRRKKSRKRWSDRIYIGAV